MSSVRPRALVIVAVTISASLLIAACDESRSSMDVDVDAPAVTSRGPVLTESQWRRSVSAICRDASAQVGAASATLTERLRSGTASFTEAEVSRGAYELSRPVIEEHLQELAALRPPSSKLGKYQRFIGTLAQELELSGRIAELLGREGAEAELLEADAGLGAAADEAHEFVREEKLWGCAGGAPPG